MKNTKAILENIRETLNTSPACQEAVGILMQRAIDLGWSAEQWETAKQQLFVTLFYKSLLDLPELQEQVATDVYYMLRGEKQ